MLASTFQITTAVNVFRNMSNVTASESTTVSGTPASITNNGTQMNYNGTHINYNGTQINYNGTQNNSKTNMTEHPSYHYDYDMNVFPCASIECVIVDRYRHENFHVLLNLTIILSILGFIGAVGNIIVIMVFARNKVKKNSTYFMLTLAIIDLMVCAIVIPGVIAREWRTKFYSDVLCKGLEFMRSLMIPSSALILVAIALDRFFLICMSTKEIMTTFVAKIVILIIMLLGMSLGIPASLSVGLMPDEFESSGHLPYCIKSGKYLNDTELYQYWYFVTGLFGVMIIAILILYLLIFKKVIQQSNIWKNHRVKIFPERRNTGTTGTFHGPVHHEPTSSFQKTDIRRQSNSTKVFQVFMASDCDSGPTNDQTTTAVPSTSGINSKALKTRNSKQAMQMKSNTNIKTMSDIKRRSTHVKTTQVLFIVTLVYIFSFLPTFLETNEVIMDNKYLTYVYFVNNAANPIIYSFMNSKFREEAKRLYCKCCKT